MKSFNIPFFLTMVCVIFLFSCSHESQPISYGKDQCHFCQMGIVDKIHAAELVTKKGKSYKFDATECMVNFLKDFDNSSVASYYTNHYEKPEELIDAKKAIYLISKQLPSPMGGNITAFQSRQEAEKIQSEKTGKLYTWSDLSALIAMQKK